MPPPRDNKILQEWAQQLRLKPDSDDWQKFFEFAALDGGRIPKHVLNNTKDEALTTQMPMFFRKLAGQTKPLSSGSGASYSTWSKGKDLMVWADSLEAQQKLPALVRKLIHGTIDNPKLCQFPADEGIRRCGWDGMLSAESGNAWVPKGKSVWEMGVDKNPGTKANADYKKRTKAKNAEAKNTTFVFVTPRKWLGKAKWVKSRLREKKWLDVIAWDCDDLEQWLETAPAVDAWLARLLGKLPSGVRDLSDYWLNLAATSNPPLTPSVFLAGRLFAEKALRAAIVTGPAEIAVSALSLSELRDFFSAVLAKADEESESSSRALIVETSDAWNQLCTAKNRLCLIPNDNLVLEKQMVAEAVKAGHNVLTQRPYTFVRSETGIRLPRADRWEMQKALEAAGFSEDRANRLAREAGGCTSILVRLASQFSGQATSAWSKSNEAANLLPLVLIGAWSDRHDDDRKLVERITGQPYGNIQQIVTNWINRPNGPLRLAEGVYGFISREDSWQLLSPSFTNDLLDSFAEIAKEILGEDDPRFEIPVGERYLAGIYKKLPKFSPQLREGIAGTITLLGTRGEHTPQGAPEGSNWRAARLVSELLKKASPKRWFSLADNLPLLAEAAPDAFLSALESDLKQTSPAIIALFEKNADGLFSSSPHTNLMWSLELLAWDTAHISRVVFALAALIKLDTGGRINPQPSGVMYDIFRFWFPQTSATIEERLQILDRLSRCEPEVAWDLLLGLIPHGHDSAMASAKPRWREFDSSQTKTITRADIIRQTDWAASQLVKIAEANPEKWPLLLESFSKLPQSAQNSIVKWLHDIDVSSLSINARLETWRQVRELVLKNGFFYNAGWALPKKTVNKLAKIEQKLSPNDPIIRSKWMFGSREFEAFGNIDTPYEEREKLLAEAQSQAIREVFLKFGLDGVYSLASGLKHQTPIRIGELLEKTGLVPDWQILLPGQLLSEDESKKLVALGYSASRNVREGQAWIDKLPLEKWSAEAVGELAVFLNFERQTWLMLQKRKPDAEPFFWKKVHPWVGRLNDEETEEVIRALLQNDRPRAAIDALSAVIHARKRPSWKTVADTIDLATTSPNDNADRQTNRMSVWEICELMKYLQDDPTGDQERLAKLEWRLLPLARHDHFVPKVLHSELARKPSFFAEVLSVVYCPKGQSRHEDPNQTTQHLAEAGYSLLESWFSLPGNRPDGTIDNGALNDWVEEARKICIDIARIEVCDSRIGRQLAYAPKDPDGTWPCQAVREVLETLTTEDVLQGFDTAVHNKQGVTTRGMNDGGEQERVLAKIHRAYADKFKVAWPRTALVMRRIADHYEARAKWHDEHAEFRR